LFSFVDHAFPLNLTDGPVLLFDAQAGALNYQEMIEP
jgi:hypothetical protein